MNYLVLIGDIVSSKKILQREQTQEKLNSVLLKLSKTNTNIESPYTITLGDEFQAVFSQADNVFFEAFEILAAVYPEKIRFSFGVGNILTPINHQQALGMDGPAFYYARQGMEYLKRSDELFSMEGLETPCTGLVKESLCLFSYTSRNWNLNRIRTFVSLCQNNNVQKIAGELQVSDKAIYKTIAAGNLHNNCRLVTEIIRIVNENLK